MPKLIRFKDPADQVRESVETPPQKISIQNKGNFERMVSTGSTLLDLAISGGRVRGGGIPGGIILEIFGPSGAGKTSILCEVCAFAKHRGAEVKFLDPEARLDREYFRIYGVELDKKNYEMPNTVNEVFTFIQGWEPAEPPPGIMNIVATDSLAALTSELELSEKGDKMGMRIAKDFNAGLRKTCALIRKNNWLIANTNQIRHGDAGETTPGGMGIPFYSSLRIRVGPPPPGGGDKYLKKTSTFKEKQHEKIVGIHSRCRVVKSTVDDPFREADIYILFGYGIDDIRANLQFNKTICGETTYDAMGKAYKGINDAIKYVEENKLAKQLREKTIDLWEALNESFKEKRREKDRE